MKMLDHPNIVNLVEVIDDPNTDHFYMVLEYVDGKRVWEGSGPPGGIGEDTARMYLRDIVSGLMYLHAHNIVHGDIKPDNVLVTRSGTVKIGDFSISQVVEVMKLLHGRLHATLLLDHRTHLANYDKDDNDELRRSPGTPVFTAPECCLGVIYHGKAADTWAVGVTLYCMILGQYPFLGETLHDTYDKIVNNPLVLPDEMNAELKDLLEGLLCKDPALRITLDAVTNHTWVIGDDGPIPEYLCWCKRSSMQKGREASDGSNDSTGINLTE
ncbi:MAP/MICROTUBULE AFFINITY-REGULATING KINASE [Salix koriyanagi]|uniref:MAP/MICROTUBULE AFFINITY-REGULATING KINASE n=1 Tax=Salix koriyanagi TaxID=2511006 RepID=A0A9Q0V0S5_9ROSI|nr:MAP/MICROTUBULE AFFINITY-REGULATING KINASE [Salix koriyanagi]